MPHHQSDFRKLAGEHEFMDSVRKMDIPAGAYMFPHMTHQDAKDPAQQQRYIQGPRGTMVLWDMPNMGRNLGLTFVYFLLIAAVTAYIAWTALGSDVGFMMAFRITGTIGILVFASSGQLNAIWFPRRTLMDFLDGIVYGILMGLVFGFFWPAASVVALSI